MQRKEKLLLSVFLLVFFTIFVTVSLHRYWQYSAWYYDFGIFYSAVSAVAQLKAPIIDHYVFTDQNILGDHFHPIIFLISPFVAIFKGGETLLVFQTLFVTLSGIFVYATAKEVLKNKFESFCILLVYFSFIGLHNALITEFHEIVLLPLPLMMFFYGMVKKHKWWYFVGLFGILLTKETVFIIPAWFGLLVAIKNKGLWRKIGLGTLLGSILYSAVVIFCVIPAINGNAYYYLSDTVARSRGVLFFDQLTIQSIFKTVASFGFLPLLSPETLLPVLFNWWSRISRFGNFDLGMHYNAEIAPTLILGTIYGWEKLKKVILKRIKVYQKSNIKFWLLGLAIFTLFFSVEISKSPALLFTNRAFYQNTKNHQFLDTLIQHIPEDGVVMAQTNIAAKLAYRKVYFLRENYYDFNPDYIVVDGRAGQEPNNFLGIQDFGKLLETIKNDANYELYFVSGEQEIYRKVK